MLSRRLVLATFGLASLAHAVTAPDESPRSFPAANVKKLTLNSSAGDVEVRGGDGPHATVSVKKLRFAEHCRLAVELTDAGDLRLENRSTTKNALDKSDGCEVSFTVELPRAALVGVDLGAGNVTLSGLTSTVRYRIGAGDARLRNVSAHSLEGRTGSGNLSVEDGQLVNAKLKIGAGSAQIALSRAPERGHIDVHVGTGDAIISLPKDTRLKSTFKAGLGSLTSEFPSAPESRFEISGTAGMGDMTIRKM